MPDPALLAPSAVEIPAPELHEARVLTSATSLGQEVRCIVASFDELLSTDPMPWQPYVTAAGIFYPKKDDRAVLSYQTDGTPLIVWWEPSAGSPDVSSSASLIDAKGDLLAGTADNTLGRQGPIGANDTLLIADSSKATGMKWAGLPTDSVDAAQIKENAVGLSEISTAAEQNFLQLAVAATRKTAFGSTEITWPGGSKASTALEITHGLGTTPVSVVSTAANSAVNVAVTAVGATKFTVVGEHVQGESPGAGTKVLIYWQAIG